MNDDGEGVGVEESKKLLEDISNKKVNSLGIVADVNLHIMLSD
jgi:ATP-dependent DNA helicase RecG